MAVEDNIISWNLMNWITVILMAAIGFSVLGLAQNLYAKRSGGASGATDNPSGVS